VLDRLPIRRGHDAWSRKIDPCKQDPTNKTSHFVQGGANYVRRGTQCLFVDLRI